MKRAVRVFVIIMCVLSIWCAPVMANVVAVAAGIAPCVEEVMEAYAEAGGEKMEFVKEACGPLANKIAMGAPYDMFLASEPRWPKWLEAKGMLVDVHAFAIGQLVMWRFSSEAPCESDVEKSKIAVPNPDITAYGNLAKQYLDEAGLWDKMMAEKRIILVGNAPQAVVAAKGSAAEIAFIPLSMAIKAGSNYTPLSGMTVDQVGGLTIRANEEVRKFWIFCRSERSFPIWTKWGFLSPDNTK